MASAYVHFWNRVPALRFLLALMSGIIFQWYLPIQLHILLTVFVFFFLLTVGYNLLVLSYRTRLKTAHGIALHLLLFSIGAMLVWSNDIRNSEKWFGKSYDQTNSIVVTLEEPLVEKPRSYKAIASVQQLISKDDISKATGNLIIYFKKDSNSSKLIYGSQLVIHKPLSEIRNSGNPGAFDYKRYCLFEDGITHQVFLTNKDFQILDGNRSTWLKSLLFISRNKTINILRSNIPGNKEQGLAEALLIGYKDNLDKNLVQSYTNTGVVHIIAISGLHLALIYGLLVFATRLLGKRKLYWFRIIIILTGLWLFTFLAGAEPSVLRAAVMFSFIGLAEVLGRRTSMYNSLALSALLLLCINPFYLWDIGFQLSYAAVFSILVFYKPISNWLLFRNKIIDGIWKMNAVTIAAQIFTLPFSIYHFHQFPLLFIITNLVAVPLSSLILIGEIILCLLSFMKPVASVLGKIISNMISFMNEYIEGIDLLPIALWDGITLNIIQAVLLTAIIAALSYWLMYKQKKAAVLGLSLLTVFMLFKSIDYYYISRQKQLIVYHIPNQQAIDLIYGDSYLFKGDDVVESDKFLNNFHLKPARVLKQLKKGKKTNTNAFTSGNKNILIVDSSLNFTSSPYKPAIDLLILSKKAPINIQQITKQFNIKQVLTDGSIPLWKSKIIKQHCEALQIPFYDVKQTGAFVMNL